MLWGQRQEPAVPLQCDCAVMAFIWGGKENQEMCMELKQIEAAYAEYPT